MWCLSFHNDYVVVQHFFLSKSLELKASTDPWVELKGGIELILYYYKNILFHSAAKSVSKIYFFLAASLLDISL